ncbi:MAG: glycosyltransferase family 4 protein [Rhodobacteraceae bacterium]|nr:glycosyltransferase family 4 protein [Paracoccaceae bacterium]
MKLALVADTFPPFRTSGAVQLRDLTREIVRQGHELTVLLPDSSLKSAWVLDSYHGAQILRLKAPPIKDIGYVRRVIGEILMPYAMRKNLRKSPLAAENWEGVIWYSPSIFHGPFVKTLKQKGRSKGYLIIRDIFPDWAVDLGLMRRGPAYHFFAKIARTQYAVADIIGVQTSGNLPYFSKWQLKYPERVLEVLPNWLDHATDTHCSIRVDQTALAGKTVFVYAGNMGIAQGMGIVIDLAARMATRPDVGFLFVGRGTEVQTLKDKARALDLKNVLFFDEINPDEIPDLYAQCHAGIVALDPRHKSHNIPGKFLTYMRSGLPVLANVNPGNDLAALIRRENVGEVCESNRLEDLEKNCISLVEKLEVDPEYSTRCADLFSKNFAVQQTVARLVAQLGRA